MSGRDATLLLLTDEWNSGTEVRGCPFTAAPSMLTAKRPALRRFLLIDRELRAARYPNTAQLAALAETNERTIRRDLDFLRDEHRAPIVFNRTRRGWEYASPTYRLPALIMTEGELVSLFMAGQILRQVRGTPYETELVRAFQKLTDFLPDEITVNWQTVEAAQSFHQSVTTLQDIDTFRRLANAVLNRRQLRIRYWTASRDVESERVVDPWHLACLDGGDWYLIGYCHTRKARRMFVPARIREIAETGLDFAIPADFHIADVFAGAFKVVNDDSLPLQTVRLRFADSVAKWVREKVWHPSQKTDTDADGRLIVEFTLRSLIEVQRWILSWGSDCDVLGPLTLRDEIHRQAAGILRQKARPLSEAARLTRTRAARRRSG